MLERAVTTHLTERLGVPAMLTDLRLTPLTGGFIAPRVLRVDVTFRPNGAGASDRSFVQKYALPREIAVMRLLRPVAETHAVPLLIADGDDAAGAWMLVPFIEGARLDRLCLPPDVISTLVRVHTGFAGRVDELSFLPRLDRGFWLGLLGNIERTLPDAPWPADSPARDELRRAVAGLRRAEQVPHALASLAPTLLHGDVHGGNMIECPSDGRTYLFDWGNARIGPAAIDLVNGIESIDALEWKDYWARIADITGDAPPARDLVIGYHVGKAMINVQYLPYAVRFAGEERVLVMSRDARDAADALTAMGL